MASIGVGLSIAVVGQTNLYKYLAKLKFARGMLTNENVQ
jgi:hypothetical protein